MASWLRSAPAARRGATVNVGADPFLARGPDEEAPLRALGASLYRANGAAALDAFGRAAPMPHSGQEPSTESQQYEQGRKQEVLVIGVLLPLATFIVLVTLYTFTFHRQPAIARVVSLLAGQLCIVAAWPVGPGASSQRLRRQGDWWPLLCGVISVGCGVGFGVLNASNMEPWVRAKFLTHYSNVHPATTSPQVLADAGIIEFAEGTELDPRLSAGFVAGWHTYCAAPVVNQDSADVPVVFWAVGMDCCSSRGGYWCGGANEESARSALLHVIGARSVLLGSNATRHYRAAVEMAAAANDLTVLDDSPILLDWCSDPVTAAEGHWWGAAGTYAALVVIVATACAINGWQLMKAER